MRDILSDLNDILEKNYWIKAGSVDTYASEAIQVVQKFLIQSGVSNTNCISWDEHIAAFSWIEYGRPQLLVFKFE